MSFVLRSGRTRYCRHREFGVRSCVEVESIYVHLSKAATEIVRFTNDHRIDAIFHVHTLAELNDGTP